MLKSHFFFSNATCLILKHPFKKQNPPREDFKVMKQFKVFTFTFPIRMVVPLPTTTTTFPAHKKYAQGQAELSSQVK